MTFQLTVIAEFNCYFQVYIYVVTISYIYKGPFQWAEIEK